MSSRNQRDRADTSSLKPTRYDQVASWLISTLVLSATSVAVLFVLWLGTHQQSKTMKPIGDGGTGRLVSNINATEEFETPQVNEVADARLIEPVVELSTLLSSESIAAIATSTFDLPTSAKSSRGLRPIGDPVSEAVPRWERWEIRYESPNLQSYAKQLDFFGIELGAAGGGKKEVDYAAKVSHASPVTRTASGTDETRLYMTWRGGRLEKLDRQLLAKARIETKGRIVLQFYPQKVDDMLALLESKHRKDGRIDQIKKTIFGVRPAGEG